MTLFVGSKLVRITLGGAKFLYGNCIADQKMLNYFIPLSEKGSPKAFFRIFVEFFLFVFFYDMALKIHTTLNFHPSITSSYFLILVI